MLLFPDPEPRRPVRRYGRLARELGAYTSAINSRILATY